MPVFANTPESMMGRSDSKDAATTCRGLTSGGRPCRRSLLSDNAPPPPRRPKHVKVRVDDLSDESLYCWQHKEAGIRRSRAAARKNAVVVNEKAAKARERGKKAKAKPKARAA